MKEEYYKKLWIIGKIDDKGECGSNSFSSKIDDTCKESSFTSHNYLKIKYSWRLDMKGKNNFLNELMNKNMLSLNILTN